MGSRRSRFRILEGCRDVLFLDLGNGECLLVTMECGIEVGDGMFG